MQGGTHLVWFSGDDLNQLMGPHHPIYSPYIPPILLGSPYNFSVLPISYKGPY